MQENQEANVNNESPKKEGFFKKVIKSIKDFEKYEDFALEKPGEGLKYFLKLVALLCVIVSIAYTYKTVTIMSDLYTGLKAKTPDFSYQDGVLTTQSEEPTIIEDYADTVGTIIIDTNIAFDKAKETYQDQMNKYGSAILATKDRVLIKSARANAQMAYHYTDLLANYEINEFTKQDVINQIEKVNIGTTYAGIFVMMFMMMFIGQFVNILSQVLVMALLAYVMGRLVTIKLKAAPAFNIGVHAITLPVLLNMIYIVVNILTGFEIKYFQLMYNAIACIYVVATVLMIKTDFVNRQMELIKLAQEQMKIKAEMEEQEEEDKEEEKDQNKETDKKEKKGDPIQPGQDKPNKKKDKQNPDEPLGDTSIVPEEK